MKPASLNPKAEKLVERIHKATDNFWSDERIIEFGLEMFCDRVENSARSRTLEGLAQQTREKYQDTGPLGLNLKWLYNHQGLVFVTYIIVGMFIAGTLPFVLTSDPWTPWVRLLYGLTAVFLIIGVPMIVSLHLTVKYDKQSWD